jgi:hypothetical protein
MKRASNNNQFLHQRLPMPFRFPIYNNSDIVMRSFFGNGNRVFALIG